MFVRNSSGPMAPTDFPRPGTWKAAREGQENQVCVIQHSGGKRFVALSSHQNIFLSEHNYTKINYVFFGGKINIIVFKIHKI